VGKIYDGDVGTEFRFNAGIDLAGSTVLTVKFKRPDESKDSWTNGEIYDGTWLDRDGDKDTKYNTNWFRYVTVEGDLNEGEDTIAWEFQIYVELPSGWKGHGEVVTEIIYETI